MAFTPTEKQVEATKKLGGPATHVLCYGGSRSGKTFNIVRLMAVRALAVRCRQAALRYRFNHIKTSIILDTWPKMMDLCFPGVAPKCRLDKTDWYYEFPNGSEVWFGGLDDKARTEKILGQEYCVDPDAKILTADLKWVAAKDIAVGQELVGFPESLDGGPILQPSLVERHEVIPAEKYRVVTDRGETVVSAQHQFVAYYDDRRHKHFRTFSWRTTEQLRVGDRIRYAGKPWEVGETKDDGWFAGLLDGEGWASRPARQAGVAQCRGVVLDGIRAWLLRHDVPITEHVNGCKVGLKGECIQVKASGAWSAMRMLGIAQPRRLDGRAVWDGVRALGGRSVGETGAGHSAATILAIEPLGVGPVVSMGTSTKTFIADGFLGHNCTLFFNECTQIAYDARNTAISRLAQKAILPDGRPLKLRAWYDENPPTVAHWTYRLFIEKLNPEDRRELRNADNYDFLSMNPADNLANLPAEYLKELENLPERQKRRFLLGLFQSLDDNALWTFELLDRSRLEIREDQEGDTLPDMVRVVVAVDPSGVKGEEDKRSDEVGIVVVGLGVDGIAYVLEDLSGRWSSEKWAEIAIKAYHRWEADRIVAEVNYGAGLVQLGIQAAGARIPFHEVRASRGKAVRAEPISVLFERGMVKLAGRFPHLEDQLCAFTTAGYMGSRSPDRADAMVWGLSDLFPQAVKGPRKDIGELQRFANVGHAASKRRSRR